MTFGHKDLIGRKAYYRDSEHGKIKRAMDDCDYLIVERRLTTDLVVPIEAFQPSEDGVVVPRMRWLLEMAPEVDTEEPTRCNVRTRSMTT